MPRTVSQTGLEPSDPYAAPLVYLDHAAATRVHAAIIEKHTELSRQFYFNPHSTHQYSENCVRAIQQAKEQLLDMLGVGRDEAEVIWTSCGTEANNLGILGCLREMGGTPTAAVESTAHSSVLAPARAYTDEGGKYIEIPVDEDGKLDLEALSFDGRMPPGVLALCHVNNETGVLQDLASIRNWLDSNGHDTYLIVDALQSFTKLEIDWHAAGIDMLALGGRKIGGPPHAGALVVRRGTPLKPIMFGGGQQKGYRPGTMDTVGIVEFVKAAEYSIQERDQKLESVRNVRDYLLTALGDGEFGEPRILSPADASPYILNIALPGYEGAIVMRALAEKNIIIATGSACSAESTSTSHVLEAMQIDRRTARSALRISFSAETNTADIDRFLTGLKTVLQEF